MASKKVRWGRVSEISHVKRIPSAEFSALPKRLKQLSAWRGMHVLRTHTAIRKFARRRGVKPSSDVTLPTKVHFIEDRTKRDFRKKQRSNRRFPNR